MNTPAFAPQLFIPSGIRNIDFYSNAFGAIELRRFTNADGSIHVAELSIGGNLFHLHETSPKSGCFSPEEQQGTTVVIGLFTPDVDAVMQQAIAVGATELSPAQDYEYGYRQGAVRDPFGHHWLIEQHV